MITLTLTQDQLDALVLDHIARLLPPEKIAAMARDEIEARIGRIPFPEAVAYLHCPTPRAAREYCRKHGIPIHRTGRKEWLLLGEIEAADQRSGVRLPKRQRRARLVPA